MNCECGCGLIPKPGNKFINGHNLKHRYADIKGKTYEQTYGIEKAKELKSKHSKSHIGKCHPSYLKNKTYRQIWGEERAEIERLQRSESVAKTMSLKGGSSKGYCEHGIYVDRNNNYHRYESSYELTRFKQLDDLKISFKKSHGIRIKYFDSSTNKYRYYIPDILVEDRKIEEIKAKWEVNSQRNIDKFSALSEYCKENNLMYEILTQDNLFAGKVINNG